jgi:hypothetical protein
MKTTDFSIIKEMNLHEVDEFGFNFFSPLNTKEGAQEIAARLFETKHVILIKVEFVQSAYSTYMEEGTFYRVRGFIDKDAIINDLLKLNND